MAPGICFVDQLNAYKLSCNNNNHCVNTEHEFHEKKKLYPVVYVYIAGKHNTVHHVLNS